MYKIKFILIIAVISIFGVLNTNALAQTHEEAMLHALGTLDNDIVKYFPRWKVCEPSLQIHIYEAFRNAGFSTELLNRSNIEILAAPGDFDPEFGNYQILLVSCGDEYMSPYQINTYFTAKLRKDLSGENSYSGTGAGRTYCHKDIPPEVPVSAYQAEAIINYYQPTDVTHAISLSLFEQNLKVGETGFWLRSVFGNDEAGYQFWSSGQANIELQRPLYINKDPNTSRAIPYLINFYFGGGYRVTSGISAAGTMFSWLPERMLNGSQSGDFIVGANFHMPFAPEFGLSVHARLPFEAPSTNTVDASKWGKMSYDQLIAADESRLDEGDIYDETTMMHPSHIVTMMHASGKFSLFYNWWLNSKRPENYIRADIGISYVESREVAMFTDPQDQYSMQLRTEDVVGLKTYKPSEAMDWLYLKLEYRNQATWPFGASVQIANQTFMGNVWVPILGNWLLLEMKYSTILRDPRPYEIKNFLMFSPVIRITI